MTKQYTQHEVITLQECRYCDCSSYHYAYGHNEPPVCASCDAEWEPVSVSYTAEELGFWEPEEEEDDSEWNRYFE